VSAGLRPARTRTLKVSAFAWVACLRAERRRAMTRGQAAGVLPELLAMMERQIAHMARLLDDLLDVSRITRGTIELRKENTDLRVAVQLGVEANRPLIERMEHALAVSLPPNPLCVYGDPARLVQIFSNLLNNAATYSPVRATSKSRLNRSLSGSCCA
jgi:signal transduction histidine kinase